MPYDVVSYYCACIKCIKQVLPVQVISDGSLSQKAPAFDELL